MRPLCLLAVVAGVVVGCGPSGSAPTGSAAKPPRGVIGVSVLTLGNPFFKTIGDTITAEAGKHGYDVVVVSGDNDVARQQNQVKDFLVRKASAIVLCPCDSKAIGPAIREANAAGVPVFTADIACLAADAKVVCHVATDNREGGRQAAHAMIEALGPAGGKVVILDYKAVESCILRVQGFKEVINTHNATAAGKVTIAAELPGDGAKDKGYKAAEDSLQAHPDLKGIFAINDPVALGARAALEKAGKQDAVKLIGFDGQPDGRQAIKEGKIYADPVQFPDEIGRKTVEAILQYLDGRPPPPQVLIPTKLYRQADALADPALK